MKKINTLFLSALCASGSMIAMDFLSSMARRSVSCITRTCRTKKPPQNAHTDIDSEPTDWYGNTILMQQVRNPYHYWTDLETIKKILEASPHLIDMQNKHGKTALMITDSPSIIRLLLHHGAAISIKDNTGNGAFDYVTQGMNLHPSLNQQQKARDIYKTYCEYWNDVKDATAAFLGPNLAGIVTDYAVFDLPRKDPQHTKVS